jgi:glycosyltransferase involved in cell wall biosynthesis
VKVLVVTGMLPSPENPARGVFVEEQVASIRALGLDVRTFLLEGPPKVKYLTAIPALRRRLDAERFDLIHAHHAFCGATALLAGRLPVVVTFHGAEVSGSSLWSRALSRRVAGGARTSIVVSQEMRRILGVANVQVIPCGVDRRLFQLRERESCRRRLGLPSGPKLVLFTGHFDGRARPLKRLDLAEAAVRHARGRLDEIRLWPVEKVPHQEMPFYIGASDAVILTSDAEGSPMIVKESLACGVPVVSVRVGDVPEIAEKLVQACRIGRRFPPESWLDDLSLEATASRLASAYLQAAATRRVAA